MWFDALLRELVKFPVGQFKGGLPSCDELLFVVLASSLPIAAVGIIRLGSLPTARFKPRSTKSSETPTSSASDMDLAWCRVCWSVLDQLVTTSAVITLSFPKTGARPASLHSGFGDRGCDFRGSFVLLVKFCSGFVNQRH